MEDTPTNPPVISPNEIEIVIASYRENLWYLDLLRDKGFKVTVYNTNESGAKAFSVCPKTQRLFDFKEVNAIAVPNICREANQYLYHMVHRHGDFYPYTFFMQADVGWSVCNNPTETLGAEKSKIDKLLEWLSITPRTPFMPYGKTQVPSKWENENVVKEWNEILHPFIVSQITTDQTLGAQFMCSKEFLSRVPLNYFKKLYSLCEEKGWLLSLKMEFVWPMLLDCYGQNWPIPETQQTTSDTKRSEDTIPETE
jgi:hypothetical protein